MAQEEGAEWWNISHNFPQDQLEIWAPDGVHLRDTVGIPMYKVFNMDKYYCPFFWQNVWYVVFFFFGLHCRYYGFYEVDAPQVCGQDLEIFAPLFDPSEEGGQTSGALTFRVPLDVWDSWGPVPSSSVSKKTWTRMRRKVTKLRTGAEQPVQPSKRTLEDPPTKRKRATWADFRCSNI